MLNEETVARDAKLERLIRQVGKGVMGLGLKLSEFQETVLELTSKADEEPAIAPTPKPVAPIGSEAPAGFAGLADTIDGLDRVIDRLETFLQSESRVEDAAAEQASRGRLAGVRVRLQGWLNGSVVGGRAPRARAELGWAVEGLCLLRERTLERLERDGISPIAGEGSFDAAHHRVVATEPGGPPGMILRTMRRGFTVRRGSQTVLVQPGLVVVGNARAVRNARAVGDTATER